MNVIKGVLDDKIGHFFRTELFDQLRADFVLNRLARGLAREFAGRQQRGHKTVAGELFCLLQNFVGNDVQLDFAFFLAGLRHQPLLGGDQRLAAFLAEFQRGVEIRLADFLRRTLVHHDVVFIADVNEIEIAFLHFGMRRVGHQLAFDAADAHRAERPGPRNVADHERRGGADDAQNVRVVFAVRAQHNALDLDLVIHSLGKEGANRTVRQA